MKKTFSFPAWKQVLLAAAAVLIVFVVVAVVSREGNTKSDRNDYPSVSSLYLRSSSSSTSSSSSSSSSYPRFLEDQAQPTTEQCTEACCQQFLPECDTGNEDDSSGNPLASAPVSIQYILMAILVAFSALFSGLTLGLMSLDLTGLQIVIDGGDEKDARCARRIYPVRKNGNLLLCTLLLGNVAVNAFFSILLADKAGGLIGLLVSTILIVIFGEIIPQAACSRHGLEVGSATVPIVKIIMVILYPVAKPLSMALDKALGEELVTTYSSSEMLKLLEIHVQENAIDKETGKTMTGALTFKDTQVKSVMTPIANTFMLSTDEKLDFELIGKIFKTGYSRIPVYEVSKDNVIGLLFTKDLIFIDPEDATRVEDFVNIFGRDLLTVWQDDKLGDVLRELKTGRSHMALVRDVNNENPDQDPFYEVKGIITLEDIIEEILGEEIVDETDAFVDGTHSQRVYREENFEFARLRLLDSKIVDERLSDEEVMAVTAHLSKNHHKVVSLLTDHQLDRLIRETRVSNLPAPEMEYGQKIPENLLYERDVPSDICTLILAGKVTVLAGTDDFRSTMSSWSVLGSKALSDSNYKPDFTAFIESGPCRCLQITRARFAAAVDASTAERISSRHSSKSNLSAPLSNRGALKRLGSQKGDVLMADESDIESERARKAQKFVELQPSRRGSKLGLSGHDDDLEEPEQQQKSSKTSTADDIPADDAT